MGKCVDVPCEICTGTGKRKIFIEDNQPTLPLSVLIKAVQMFEKCYVEVSFDNDKFVLRLDMRGTYKKMIKQQDDFHEWLMENYPDEIAHKIILSVNRIEP